MSALDNGARASATATNTTSAVATITGVAGQKTFITDISASSDKAGAIILVKNGSTTIWQDIVGTVPYNRNFTTPLVGSVGADVSVTIDGTAGCKSNIAGVQL